MLDRLWYLYSYIYRPLTIDNEDNDSASTTKPDIRYEFKSLHASLFRFLVILKYTTPSISMTLCTTSTTLHLLAFLESTVPLFSPPSCTLFVIFFLSPVGAIMLLRFELSYSTMNIVRSNLFLSPVSAFDRDTDFHLIDQGKVGYLYHLQILLFFNLQDDNNVNGVNDVTISDVATMMKTIYELHTTYTFIYDDVLQLFPSVQYGRCIFDTTFDTTFTSASHASHSYKKDSSPPTTFQANEESNTTAITDLAVTVEAYDMTYDDRNNESVSSVTVTSAVTISYELYVGVLWVELVRDCALCSSN